ncbi:MAG: hypothetical protein KC656_36560, partial [Myxococcales bacterium]|nr:hypothetical protein [Myxococcales bacterium]
QARWPVDMGERSFIHELGLRERLCSFTKGCYIGQEVINRMETMGKVNKRLTGLELDGPVGVGAEVHLDDKAVGVLSSEVLLDGRHLGLAVLRAAAWQPGTSVTLRQGEQETGARVASLPFSGAAAQ